MLLLQHKTNKNGKPHLVMRLSAQNQVGLFRFLNKKINTYMKSEIQILP